MHKEALGQEHSNLEQQQIHIPQSVIAEISTNLSFPYNLSSPITLDISTLTDQLHLNEMIKKLLIEEKADEIQSSMEESLQKITFDFLVADKVLRGNLKSHFIRYEISTESTIQIEYFIAFEQLEEGDPVQMNDWIAALDLLDFNGDGTITSFGVLAGMYNGELRLTHDLKNLTKQEKKLTFQADTDPIKSLKVLAAPQQETYYIISGGLGEQIRISTFQNRAGEKKHWNLQGLNSHQGSILTMDINPMLDGHFCTAGNHGSLNIWKIPQNFLEETPEVKLKNKKKKQANLRKADFVATENFCKNQGILASKWATTEQILIGCSDHSIKLIDVEKMTDIRSLLTKDSITSAIDYAAATCMLISSHEDGYLRAWDLRASETSPINTYKSHTKYVSCVQFCPRSCNIFASGAYDSHVNIWDSRSVFPLQIIQAKYDKVLALQWITERNLVFGGSGPQLTSYII